jgi:hypothetical protein
MSVQGFSLIVLALCALLSFLIFRPVYLQLAKGKADNKVAIYFTLHTVLGAACLSAAFLIGRGLDKSSLLPLIAAALGWTLPAGILAVLAAKKLRHSSPKKEV